ncbi:MAG: protein translocase subunit SecD [Actinobacteria bacterium]|nr:protein translocase subunit SecD [Actinomycetota bacterium]MCB9388677.1 protein translocase subunit SecD [Acidimicrobiia bacterium]
MKVARRVLALSVGSVAVLLLICIIAGYTPHLGLDLRGGVSVTLCPAPDPEDADAQECGTATTEQLDDALGIIRDRVDGLGVAEPAISRQGDTIVVDMPGIDDRERARSVIGQTGELQFRPVLTLLGVGDPAEFKKQYDAYEPPAVTPTSVVTSDAASPTTTTGTNAANVTSTTSGEIGTTSTSASATDEQGLGQAPHYEAPNYDVALMSFEPAAQSADATTTSTPADRVGSETTAASSDTTATTAPSTQTTVDDSTPTTVTTSSETTTTTVPLDELTALSDESLQMLASLEASGTPVKFGDSSDQDAYVVLAGDGGEDSTLQTVYLLGPAEMTGEGISHAKAELNVDGAAGGNPNEWYVSVSFDGEGSQQWADLTTKYVGSRLAIVLDDFVQSAPNVNSAITGGEAIITGSFNESGAKDLALALRYGALPVSLVELTTEDVSPTLGADQLRAGMISGLIGLILVMAYIFWLYRILGIVVFFTLSLTAAGLYAVVSLLSEWVGLSLTIAGVTGLIVSIGMGVDSNIVYFERLREEVLAGRTARSAVNRGFKSAFRTIIAADTVSLLGAFFLYMLAAGSVRGFAFYLGLATLLDLFFSYTIMHPLVQILANSPKWSARRQTSVENALLRNTAEAAEVAQ